VPVKQSKGIKISWRAGLDGTELLRGRGPSGGPPGASRRNLEASTPQGRGVPPWRAGAWWGQTRRPDTRYRTCIKGQGSNHIKIEKQQFDRAVVARGGDDHNHGASCAPKVERGREGERGRENERGRKAGLMRGSELGNILGNWTGGVSSSQPCFLLGLSME
jgi:hypothetical protein